MSLTRGLPSNPARAFVTLCLVAGFAGAQERDGGGFAWGTGAGPGKSKEVVEDDPVGRREWWRQRLGGELTPEFMARYMREAEKQRIQYPDHFRPEGYARTELPEGTPLPIAIAATTWTNLGPTKSTKMQNGSFNPAGTNSGRLRTILPDPTNANVLYVLTSGGGFWKTTNLLDSVPTWRCLSDRVGSNMGGAAAFGPPVSGVYSTLYLGLGDAFDSGVGGFVVKSTDSGDTWSPAIQLTGTVGATTYTATRILDLKVDDTGTGVVLVGTNVGLFRSTDSGASYSIVDNAAFNGKYVWSIVRTHIGANPNVWVASAEDYAAGTLGALMISTDGGATWSPLSSPLTGVGRMTLAVAAPGDSDVYCFAANTGDSAQKDLYRSTDGGQTWTATATNSTTQPATTNGDQSNNDYMHTQAFYNHMVLVDPTVGSSSANTRSTVYVGGNLSSAKNTNFGATGATAATKWKVLSNWLPGSTTGTASLPYVHADFHCGAISKVGATTYTFFGTDGGLFMSTDGGTTWDSTKNTGIVSHLVYAMASGPLNNCDANSVLMGLQDNGTHNRVGGTSVFDQTKGGDGFGVGWSQSTNTYSFASYVYNQISRCISNPPDDISKWAAFTTGLGTTNSASYYFVTPIITAPPGADNGGTVFYTYGNTGTGANSKKVFRTTGGGNWTSLGTLSTGVRAVSHGIGAHPTDPNRLAAAAASGILNVTTTGAFPGTAINLSTAVPASGSRTWKGYNSSATWVNNNVLFATSESPVANSIHVAKTTDGGTSWAAADNGLPDLPVVKIVVDPGDPNTLYAATWLGVYRTTDQGANWSLFGSGLPQALVSDLYIHPQGGFLRAAIYGRGIWQVGPTPIYTAPSFSTQPTGSTFTPGTSFTLTGVVSNTYPTVTYQWKRNGVALANGGTETISGATTASLTVATPTCSASPGDYTLVATNCAGTTVSSAATMTSSVASPVITTQPANIDYVNGQNFTLSVVATGATTYQWRKGGTNLSNGGTISGATTATLTITGAVNGTAGTYDCVVGNGGGCSVTSDPAQVQKSVQAPNVLQNPANTTVTAPASASFTIKSGGGGVGTAVNLSFQWRRNGVPLTHGSGGYAWVNTSTGTATTSNGTANLSVNNSTGTASSVLTINPTADAMNGGTYDCVVTNSAGTDTSATALLTVLRQYTPATAVTLTPSTTFPVSRTGGSWPVTFTATGSGSVRQSDSTPAPPGAYDYQFWFYIDSNLGWTMVQDYGNGNTWTLPSNTQPGTYGVGVDVRTSPTVRWDKFTAINAFSVTPAIGPGSLEDSAPKGPAIPAFDGGKLVIEPDDLARGNGPRYKVTFTR